MGKKNKQNKAQTDSTVVEEETKLTAEVPVAAVSSVGKVDPKEE